LACLCLGHLEWKKFRIFRNSENSVHQLLDKVKLFSYRWLRTTNVTLVSNFHCWWSRPLLCLGIDWLLFIVLFLLYSLVNFCSPPRHTLCWGSYLFSDYIFHFCLFKKIYI
jgi:hypothetical protein